MSVKYSELPVTTNPAAANRVAVLDTADGTLKTTTLENAVKGAGVQSGFSGTTAEVAAAIQAGVIKEGMTVNITDDYEAGASGESGTKLTQAEFNALPAAQQNVGKYWITDGSSALTVDTELSTTSHNPVENGVITTEINKINTQLENKVRMKFKSYGSPSDTKLNVFRTIFNQSSVDHADIVFMRASDLGGVCGWFFRNTDVKARFYGVNDTGAIVTAYTNDGGTGVTWN